MGPARLERATSCSGGKRSIQLSYGPKLLNYKHFSIAPAILKRHCCQLLENARLTLSNSRSSLSNDAQYTGLIALLVDIHTRLPLTSYRFGKT